MKLEGGAETNDTYVFKKIINSEFPRLKKNEKIFVDVDGNENVVHKTLEERLKTDEIDIKLIFNGSKLIYVTLNNLIVPQSKKERHKVRFTQTYNQIKLFNDDRPPIVYNLSNVTNSKNLATEKEFNESILNFTGKIEFSYFQG